MPVIEVAAVLITDAADRLLLVRKLGTDRFMQAGGKPERGETPARTAARELAEELELTVPEADLEPVGDFEADAANEPGHTVLAHVFRLVLADPGVRAAAELAEVRWVTRAEASALGDRLAPLARDLLAVDAGFRPLHFTAVETERLRLRLLTPGDTDAVHRYQSREDVCRYLLFGPRTRDQVAEQVRRHATATAVATEGDYLQLGVERLADGELLGDLYFTLRSAEQRTAEVGWTFHPDHHGRGYATEGARALLGLAFDRMRLHRVVAELDPANAPSAALCRRLGMRHEAHHVEDLWFRGGWADTDVFAILDREHKHSSSG